MASPSASQQRRSHSVLDQTTAALYPLGWAASSGGGRRTLDALEDEPRNAADSHVQCPPRGHSKGGKVAFFTAAIDPRVDIVFGWDPSNAGGPPCGIAASLGLECNALPTAPNCLAQKEGKSRPEGILQYARAESFIFGVPPDAAINPTAEHNSIHFYRGALSPASLVYMNGGHAAWLTGGLGALLGDANIIRVTKTVQTAKLLRVFYGATGLERYLPGGDYLTQRGALVRQVATK